MLTACESGNFQDSRSSSTPSGQRVSENDAQETTIPGQRSVPRTEKGASDMQTFCQYSIALMEKSPQDMASNIALLCNGDQPTPLAEQLVSSPWQGTGPKQFSIIENREDTDTITSYYSLAYAVILNGSPDKALVYEEANVETPYAGEVLAINSVFLDPPANKGDAYTAFTIQQNTIVDDRVAFDENSIHDLRMYQLTPFKFDLFLSVRTLQTPSEQFKVATVTRVSLQDPNNADQTISVAVLNFEMNSRERHETVITAFQGFVESDLESLVNLAKSE